mgnify:CR=1 FL=1|tara:strand:+ start:35 stop:277 length:243 start_codon:yes stop_codon:yes gene_type:complete
MFSENEIFETIAEALELNKDLINIKSSQENIEKWDSLGQLSILSLMDEKTNGKIADIPELASAYSVQEIINILKENLLVK